MKHSHNHIHDAATKNIGVAFFINLFFALFELVGGIYTNSIAIISDAVHDFGDSLSLAISWFLQRKSNQKSDNKYSYGYKRFSLLGAIIMSVAIITSSIFIIKESISRIIYPQESNAQGMLLLAVFGIIVNGVAALRLKKGNTISERAVYLHFIEDVLGWIAVLIASIVLLFYNIPILDPILSLGITIWVLSNVYKNMKNAFKILLQGSPENIDVNKLQYEILKIKLVNSAHHIHLWSIDGLRNVMTLHVVIESGIKQPQIESIKNEIRGISNNFNIQHTTIEIELEMKNCELNDGCVEFKNEKK